MNLVNQPDDLIYHLLEHLDLNEIWNLGLEYKSEFQMNDLKIKDILDLQYLKIIKINDCSKKISVFKDLYIAKDDCLQIFLNGVKIKKFGKFDEYKDNDVISLSATLDMFTMYENSRKNLLKFQVDNYAELEIIYTLIQT